MIHISNDLYLNTAQDAGNPLIGYQSILTVDTVTADSSPDDTPVINLVNEQTNQYWISDTIDDQYIYIGNPSQLTVNYIGIAKHNFGSAEIQWQLQGSNNFSDWDNITETVIPENDGVILSHFNDTDYLDYRLKLVAGSTNSEFPQIAHIKLGKVLVMESCIRAPHAPVTLSRSSDVIINTSEDGAYLGRILKRQFLKTSYQFKNISPAFYRGQVDPFSVHAVTGAFFVSWKPFSYPQDVAFGWTKDDISFQIDNDNGLGTVEFSFQAVA